MFHDPAVARSAISDLMNTMRLAWNGADPVAFGSVFTEDVDFVNIVGQAFRGRSAVVDHHAQLFASVYAGSTVQVGELHISVIREDVAAVEVPGTVATSAGERHTHALAVCTFSDGVWAIRVFHNMVPMAG